MLFILMFDVTYCYASYESILMIYCSIGPHDTSKTIFFKSKLIKHFTRENTKIFRVFRRQLISFTPFLNHVSLKL